MLLLKKGIVVQFPGDKKSEVLDCVDDFNLCGEKCEPSARTYKDNDIDEVSFLDLNNELKTKFNVIHSAIQLVEVYNKNNFDEKSKVKIDKCINLIKIYCLESISYVNNLQDLSNIEENNFDLNINSVNIVEVIENIVDNIAPIIKKRQLNIVFDTNVEENTVMCDAREIEKAMLNIFSNVVKQANAGDNINVNIVSNGTNTEISVSYMGQVVDDKQLDTIFAQKGKITEKIKNKSLIELYLSKLIVEIHGGKLTIDRGVGRVNTYIVVLPSKNINTIYYSYIKDSKIHLDNLLCMINMEFADLINNRDNH